jgi:hypothetical protein
MVLAVGVAAATTGVGVAVRRRRQATAPFRGRAARPADVPVPPDVAAALERRTLRRGRLRLTDEAVGADPDSHGNASD